MDKKQVLIQEAIDCIQQAQSQQAIELCTAAIEKWPEFGRFIELRGIAYEQSSDIHHSLEDLERALVLVPLCPAGYFALAKCYLALEKNSLAKDNLKFLLELPKTPTAMLPGVASVFGFLNEDELALRTCLREVKELPRSSEAWFRLAFYMERLEYSLERIEPVLRKAVSIDPNRFILRFSLMKCLSELGREQEAYEVVKGHVTAQAVGSLCCRGCVQKLANVMRSSGDQLAFGFCQDRLEELPC
ncbi:MAG: hypothetical protein VX438_03135 [Planctomycetota bacterium]|nr:hypothetical protein [Planctomycetota bacterium]